MSIELEIEQIARVAGPGQHTGLRCPACRHSDNALSMYVGDTVIKAVCHRASCGFKYTNGNNWQPHTIVRPSRARPYTGELHLLSGADVDWFGERFYLNASSLTICKSDGRYFLPIYAPDGNRRGWVSRRPWEGSPLSESEEGLPYVQPLTAKSLTYMDDESPVMSWYRGLNPNAVVLVEDQISGMRVAQDTQLDCVALLGTGINEEKVSEIQRHSKHILIALDSDATGQAFSHARKWGQAFDSCRVVILHKDIKDSATSEVRELFE